MSKIKGISVILVDKVEVGRDPFGAPIYNEKEIVVDNVLVSPTQSEEVINQYNLTGRRAVYTLAIPKGDTNNWTDREVRFFGKRWKVFGEPLEGIEEMIPLGWNKKVTVERYEV